MDDFTSKSFGLDNVTLYVAGYSNVEKYFELVQIVMSTKITANGLD